MMDEAERRHLAEIWLANEQKLKDARNLKAGAESPVDRIEDLEADQDQIEYELGLEYLERLRKENENI